MRNWEKVYSKRTQLTGMRVVISILTIFFLKLRDVSNTSNIRDKWQLRSSLSPKSEQNLLKGLITIESSMVGGAEGREGIPKDSITFRC